RIYHSEKYPSKILLPILPTPLPKRQHRNAARYEASLVAPFVFRLADSRSMIHRCSAMALIDLPLAYHLRQRACRAVSST
ncbi:hypothetical protein, partial [Mesorhizobium sp. M7A.F.Ca.MR.148.00.0.0]|uniref:hypothetical protein n=1 Tax=Mesorhizobium sp. M7A.F.Ca.MR.148.00.0.0 TaxID=2496775 RepID=UPI0019D116FD